MLADAAALEAISKSAATEKVIQVEPVDECS